MYGVLIHFDFEILNRSLAHKDFCNVSFSVLLADGTCAGVRCHPDATCEQNTPLGPVCVCKAGYQGDGQKCSGNAL